MSQGSATRFGNGLRALLGRVSATLDETGPEFPLYAETGPDGATRWVTTPDGNWCAGYWIGLLWLAAKHAENPVERARLLNAAHGHLPALLSQPTAHLFAGVNHDYAGFFGFDNTGEDKLRAIGIRGADAMLALYNPDARHIPIGTYVTAPAHTYRTARTPKSRLNFAAVDAIHTSLPVLWRAHAETGVAGYRDVAMAHLQRHLDWHVRGDGSTMQMTIFDPVTGARQESFNTLAETDDGCWSRGLGWHIAGLARAYLAIGDAGLLDEIARSMAYYEAHTGDDLIPPWDFAVADPSAHRDASAAAITAYGLLSLGRRREERTGALEARGRAILESLLRNCQVSAANASNYGAILHGCYRAPRDIAVDNELIWTDFYAALALDLVISNSGASGEPPTLICTDAQSRDGNATKARIDGKAAT